MPRKERFKTKYPGVFFILGKAENGDEDRIYYIYYRKAGRQIEEKIGWQGKDAMTPAKAALARSLRLSGKEETNQERRDAEIAAKLADAGRWTFSRLWTEYKAQSRAKVGVPFDNSRFNKYLAKPFGDKTPDEVITLDVDRLRIQMLKAKAPQTVKSTLALLKRLGICQ